MHINVYVNIFYIYLYTYSTYTHTRAHIHTHTQMMQTITIPWCNTARYTKLTGFVKSIFAGCRSHSQKQTRPKPQPVDWTRTPTAPDGDPRAARGWPQHPTTPPKWRDWCQGGIFTLGHFFLSLDALIFPEPLATSPWQAHGYSAAEYRGNSRPPRLPTLISQKQSQRKAVEGGTKLKLLSLIQVDQWGVFSINKGPFSLFFLPLKLVLQFLKANFTTNGESSQKIRQVYANSNKKKCKFCINCMEPAPKTSTSSTVII